MGLNSFLERTEKLRSACGVSKADLFNAAIELSKVLLIWYRSNIREVNSWSDLIQELRKALIILFVSAHLVLSAVRWPTNALWF